MSFVRDGVSIYRSERPSRPLRSRRIQESSCHCGSRRCVVDRRIHPDSAFDDDIRSNWIGARREGTQEAAWSVHRRVLCGVRQHSRLERRSVFRPHLVRVQWNRNRCLLHSGWTPSTFVSSRGDRAKKRAARPEDFMDEEDLAELRESRKLVDETEEMDFGGTAGEKRRVAGEPEEQECVRLVLMPIIHMRLLTPVE